MRWRKEVLEFIIKRGQARYEEIRQRLNPHQLLPTSTLTYALNDLTNAGLIEKTASDAYRATEVGRKALEFTERAEKGQLSIKRGEGELVSSALKAHLLTLARILTIALKPNPKEWPRLLNVGTVIRLRCGHYVPVQCPWPDTIVCPDCNVTTIICYHAPRYDFPLLYPEHPVSSKKEKVNVSSYAFDFLFWHER